MSPPRAVRDVVLVDAARTPFGKAGATGLYAETRADDLVVAVFRELLRRWSVHDDLWLRRASILGQLGSGLETDRGLLVEVIAPNADRPEFWLRKAIGWSLRSYAYTDPDWVVDYVTTHRDRLSPLSFREATKHLTLAP